MSAQWYRSQYLLNYVLSTSPVRNNQPSHFTLKGQTKRRWTLQKHKTSCSVLCRENKPGSCSLVHTVEKGYATESENKRLIFFPPHVLILDFFFSVVSPPTKNRMFLFGQAQVFPSCFSLVPIEYDPVFPQLVNLSCVGHHWMSTKAGKLNNVPFLSWTLLTNWLPDFLAIIFIQIVT